MALYRVVSEISMSKNITTLKFRSRVNQGRRKWTEYGFLLVFYSNFIRNMHHFLRYSTSKML